MNGFNQRQVVTALVMFAGLAGCAAQQSAVACPPEDGSTPPPAQQIEREVTVRTLPGVTFSGETGEVQRTFRRIDGNRLAVLASTEQPGSTLEKRIYKPGEAVSLYGLRSMGDGPERTLRVKEDGRDIRVEQRGGKVKATINGKEVPADAVTVKDGTIEVRDESGNTVLKEEWTANVNVRTFAGTATQPGMPALPGVTWGGNQDDEALPKVMLGITMDSADEEIIEQLGLPEGDYAIIATVPDGLPASKAGLQPRDIVVSVDGQAPASSDTIREVMAKKNPGDTLKVEVARKGNRLKLDIPLEAFDAKRFKAFGQTMGHDSEAWSRIAKELHSQALTGNGQARSQAEMDRLREQLILTIPRGENGEPRMFVNPSGGNAKLEERLNAMQAQLEKLEAMLRRLDSRAAVPPIPPVPPVAPVAPVAPSGGGGTPKPWFAVGL